MGYSQAIIQDEHIVSRVTYNMTDRRSELDLLIISTKCNYIATGRAPPIIPCQAILLGLVEKFCPLARSNRPLAKLWLSRHIVAMQKQKEKLYKKFLLTRSQENWASYKTGFTPGHCGIPGQFMNRTSSRLPSVTQKSFLGMFVKGQRRETLSPG